MFHQFVDLVVELAHGLGYWGVFLLMVLESSFVPFPSEVVLIPAGYLVYIGKFDMFAVCFAGISGSLVGALINYYLAMYLGRAFILKFGHYFLLPEAKYLSLEKAFLKHGKFATFVGRLIFGIRQWISIPAGLSRMSLAPFVFLTTLGAGIWVVILVTLGYVLGEGQATNEMAKQVGYWLLIFVAVMIVAYIYWNSPKNSKGRLEGQS